MKPEKLINYAILVDKVDRITGPLESTLQISGVESLQTIGNIISLIEDLVIKVPFVITYISSTKDLSCLASWLPKEVFAHTMPYGDMIDIMHSYKNHTMKIVHNKE